MNARSAVSVLLFILGIAVMLVQLWFQVWTQPVFIKLMITIGAFFVVAIVVTFVGKEVQATRNLENSDEQNH